MELGQREVHCFGCVGHGGRFVKVTLKRGSRFAGPTVSGWQHVECAQELARRRAGRWTFAVPGYVTRVSG
jgi:hypothetical protein